MPWLYQSFSPAEQLAPSISKHSLGWAGGWEGGMGGDQGGTFSCGRMEMSGLLKLA